MTNGISAILADSLNAIAFQPMQSLVERLFDLQYVGSGLGDFLYYALIYKFVQAEIRSLGPDILQSFVGVAVTGALTLMTIWIIFQGYRIMSGQSRDSLASFALSTARTAFIIIFASTMALFGRDIHTLMTEDLNEAIVEMVTDETGTTASEMIEQNMTFAQVAIYSIDAIQVSNETDPNIADAKTRAMWMAGFGAAGPAVTAGVILLMFEVAIALFVGFGPLFVLFLISDKTSSLFWKWLWYGIGTLFALGVFAAMSAIALKVVGAVAASLWGTSLLGSILGQNLTEGMTSVAMQQGGIGLLLTLLLVSVPPIAANFFQGALGAASTYNVFQGAGSGGAGVAQRPPGGPPASYASGSADVGARPSTLNPSGQFLKTAQQTDEIKPAPGR